VSQPSVEDLVARLERERADADRRYNDALTALDRAIQALPTLPHPPPGYDAAALSEANRGWDILPQGAPRIDRSPKGRLRAFVWRLVGPPLEAQKHFNASLIDHLNRNVQAQQDLPRTIGAAIDELRRAFEGLVRFESLLVQYLQTITTFVDTRDRALGSTDLRERLAIAEQRLLALRRDVEIAGTPQGSSPRSTPAASLAPVAEAATYVGFEDRFRGPQHEIRRRVEDYVPLLAAASSVVDIGCGRGELLELLAERGVPAEGVDANPAMVEVCRTRGLRVQHGDALADLLGRADGSVGGLVAIQVVEHFEPGYLARFLDTAHRKMRPGAPLILETINPACWMAFFETYIRDLTHQRPLHPDTLRYLVQASGFQDVDVQYRQPVNDADKLERAAAVGGSEMVSLVAVVNAHADKLNARMFSSMDYAVIARR
jgi:O-antigen chain-terminating methyltransferase